MALVTTSHYIDGGGFAINATTSDASGCGTILTPATGKAIHLRSAIITCVSAITVTLGYGTTSGAVETTIIGPVPFAAGNGSPVLYVFNPPLRLTKDKALTLDASGSGNVCVFVQGFQGK